MTTTMLVRTAALAALGVMSGLLPAVAAEPTESIQVPATHVGVIGDGAAQFVPLGVGKTVVVELPRDTKDVLVADPKIANAVVRTSRRAYLIGVAVGQTNVYFFDAEGRQIAGFDIAVSRDLNGIRAGIKRALPDADIRVDGLADGVMLSGTAANPVDAQQAYNLASRLAGDANKVVNNITVRGRDQVMLRVTVAEVQRDIIKQLGVDLNGALSYGTAVLDFNNANPFPALGQALVGSNALTGTIRGLSATLRAMERAGVIRTLAEPNLTAISGESATFLAGGEFPVLAGYTCSSSGTGGTSCQPSIQFKKFGVSLSFNPMVLSEGRINLRLLTEVSELTSEGALTIQSASGVAPTTIPAIRTRRAETTIELPSGGTLALAGMIQEQTKQQLNGMPGMMNLPVLGALFKSRDYINRQSELVVLVTPYVVRAVAQKDVSKPDDGYADASDASGTLIGRLNRIYGLPGRPEAPKAYRGNFGFILD